MRNKIFLRVVAVYLSLNLLFEILYPTFAFALTAGPEQPESSSFTPVGTADMVNLFSGDFNYNVPLMDVGGYPVNISYQSGISMDQESSWVGLGWNINPGAINRNMRGLPDDFDGDKVIKEFNSKPNKTFGAGVGFGFEIAGFEGLNLHFGLGAKYNNYTGVGFEQSINASFSAGDKAKTRGTASLGLKSSADGLDISPSVSASVVNDRKEKADNQFGASIGASFNSRVGLKALSISTSMSQGKAVQKTKETKGSFTETGSSIGTGCSISMANNTYVPGISMPMKSLSVNASFKMGVTLFSIDGSLDVSAYYSEQRLAETSQSVPAFGFLYSQNGSSLDKVMLDFNREKEGSFTKHTPSLPLTNFSYDVFSVSGQGVGGAFRPFRSDLGYVFDSRSSTTSDSYSIGVELGSGNLLKGGGDISINDINSTAGKWSSDNTAADILRFKAKGDDALFEPCYFKEQGEKNVDSYSQLFDDIGGDEPVRVGLSGNAANAHATGQFVKGEQANGPVSNIPTKNYRAKRQKRNQLFSFIKNGEYSASAVDKSLNSVIYHPSANSSHIGEITTTKTDGSRYVYGIPAYNIKQQEVTFSMGGHIPSTADAAAGLIPYNPGSDNTKGNKNGIDNYFSSTELPPYAHTYLLTAVLSPDYVDITGDGLSKDDYGTYTKFSYTNVTAEQGGIYNWRTPFDSDKANFNEGLRSDLMDEQGNYIYGEKEIWILKLIETKNYVAEFTTVDRRDGCDAAGKDGGLGNNRMKLLKTISLYSTPDYALPAVSRVPIKEVHFVYDYSLCPGTLNNSNSQSGLPSDCELSNAGGKLTLKQMYFTYGKSFKAKLNPYNFTYSTFNPAYGLKDYDKWGNYKRNNTSPGGLLNSDFPYVAQDIIPVGDPDYDSNYPNRTYADLYSTAWSLSKIDLPSGGTINVNYESDDYAYVQDRRAMQMFKITGVASYQSNPNTANPTSGGTISGGDYLFFKLQTPVAVGNTAIVNNDASWVSENYLKGISDLYFRVLVNANPVANEYVSGYAPQVWSQGICKQDIGGTGYYNYGYIQFKDVDLGDNKGVSLQVNPISKAAVQFARINTPKQAYGNNIPVDPEVVTMKDVVSSLIDAKLIKNLIDAFQGANGALYNKGLGKQIVTNKSWLRLLNPTFKKFGGGLRVKKISISDNWGTMATGGQDFNYGQEYEYKKVENGIEISSGVASYEPMVGGDENPFRLPVTYSEKMKMAADLDFYKEEPFGETFFPSPSVGYSKVTVRNLQHQNVKRHATGYVVNEFYTSRDFPTITKRTPVDSKATTNVGQALQKLLKLKVKDYMTASQGFSIELNDMDGKQMATWVYAEDQAAPISGVEYKYKSSGNKLNNHAVAMNKDGTISSNAQIGVDYDFVADMREQSTDVTNAGAALQIYSMLVGFVPVIIPPILPIYSSERTRFRSASVTKVIHRFGLLDETIAYDLGSKVSTRNLAYDSETGEVVLTKTKNDFNDEVFSLNYPAHLAYDRMGPGYKNVSVVVNQAAASQSGKITDPAVVNVLVPGDEIQISPAPSGIKTGDPTNRFWISKIGGGLYVISQSGNTVQLAANSSIKVIRSGRRNQQGLPIGSFTSLVNPVDKDNDGNYDSQLAAFDNSYKVLSAGASEFSEVWRNFCECGINPNDPNGPKNPYILGLLGNWRAKKSYTFLSDRNQTKLNDNSNIRKDGTYSFFHPFWSPNLGNDWTFPSDLYIANTPNPQSDWTWTSEITEFSPFGPELENKDALNRFSSAIYGYNNALPMAVASNARYKEIAFDGFEDYDFGDCRDDHFSFDLGPLATQGRGSNYGYISSTGTVTVTNQNSHSGKRSINVKTGSSVSLTKNISDCPVYVPVQSITPPPPGN